MNLDEFPLIGKRLLQKKVTKEGGPQCSKTLRMLTEKKHNVSVGLYSYGGVFANNFNYSNGGSVEVGRYCSFSSDIHYFPANHPVEMVTTSPFFFRKEWGFDVNDVQRSALKIGNDVWIGYGVMITSKCSFIGNGAVIAAGSIVTGDVEPYSIVAGVPAKTVKMRFSEQEIEALEKSTWWELSPEELYQYYHLMKSPVEFSEAVLKYKSEKV